MNQSLRFPEVRGLVIEAGRLSYAGRLLKLAAIAARAAALTLQLVQARDGRGAEPAAIAFDAAELSAREALGPRLDGRSVAQRNPHPLRSLARAARIVAR